MRKFTDWLFGYYRISLTGGSPQWCLNRLVKSGIPFWDVVWRDEFSVTISVYPEFAAQVSALAAQTMCQVDKVRQRGAPERYRGLRRRFFLLLVLMLAAAAAVILPKFIWFYQVDGNVTVPSERIIRAVQDAGVDYGAYGKHIRPQAVRDVVLTQIPELAWLTVNQSGGRAWITVRERSFPEPVEDRRLPGNIVASADGLITEISVLEGSAAAAVGDTVRQGQLLISGYMDLEYKYRVCRATGEVYARTWREITAVTPAKWTEKMYTGEEKTVFYLCIGRKRIKISSGSGISMVGCDKMTQETALTLPGGFTLPVSLVRETYRFYEPGEAEQDLEALLERMKQAVLTSVRGDMIAGTVENSRWTWNPDGEVCLLQAALECREMIGRSVDAEIFKGEVEHDGTSH